MDTPISGQLEQDGALVKFEKLTADSIGLQELVQAIRASFDIIAPWTNISSKIDVISYLAIQMREESMKFLQSIHLSYRNAQSGFSFAKKAELLSIALSKPIESLATKTILHYIEEMREIAREAHHEATSTAQSFRDNKQGFDAVFQNAFPSNKVQLAISVGEVIKEWERQANQLASKPVWHPSRLFGALRRSGSKAEAFQAEAEKCTMELQRYDAVVDYLEPAVEQLKTLMGQINSLAEYWHEMDSVLEDMHKRVNELQNDVLLRMKVQDLVNDWRKVGGSYMVYEKELAKLRDVNQVYAAPLPDTSASLGNSRQSSSRGNPTSNPRRQRTRP